MFISRPSPASGLHLLTMSVCEPGGGVEDIQRKAVCQVIFYGAYFIPNNWTTLKKSKAENRMESTTRDMGRNI